MNTDLRLSISIEILHLAIEADTLLRETHTLNIESLAMLGHCEITCFYLTVTRAHCESAMRLEDPIC